jgi:hypothetical protein
VESLDEAALSVSLATDADFAVPRWLILAHVVNHGSSIVASWFVTSLNAATHPRISTCKRRSP